MWEQAKCWMLGHEEWSSADGAWFCMRCGKTRYLETQGSPIWSSRTPLDRSVGAAYVALSEQRQALQVPARPKLEAGARLLAALTSMAKRRAEPAPVAPRGAVPLHG